MTDRERGRPLLHDDLYREAVKEIGTLKEKLPQDAFAALAREVIRRLSDHPVATAGSVAFPSDAKIDELARALMEVDAEAGIAFIQRVQDRGASVETVYLAYLAEAAKRLGVWWEEDLVSFAEVTAATGHIYAVMRGLKPLLQSAAPELTQPSAFFTAVPGETHLLGVSMAADLFRKQGWDVAFKREFDHDEIVQYAAHSQMPLIGLSAGGEHCLAPLARLVVALRISVPDTSIMVSGAILNTSYESVKALRVDILPTSMDDAIEQAQNVWTETLQRYQVS